MYIDICISEYQFTKTQPKLPEGEITQLLVISHPGPKYRNKYQSRALENDGRHNYNSEEILFGTVFVIQPLW